MLLIPLIAISLSMDAFSLSLAYGTLNVSKKQQILLSIIVGCFHFFMPILGLKLGITILKVLPVKPDVIIFIILLFLGIQMILESLKEDKIMNIMNTLELILFAFAVSLDSFSTGIGLLGITDNWLFSSLVFAFTACFFTFLGLKLGKKLSLKFGHTATLVGGITLIIIGVMTIFI